MIDSLVISADAERDLEVLSEYLMDKFGQQICIHALEDLFDKMRNLQSFPEAGIKMDTQVMGMWVGGFYWLKTSKNTILYDFDQHRNEICILRIVDNRRNVIRELESYLGN